MNTHTRPYPNHETISPDPTPLPPRCEHLVHYCSIISSKVPSLFNPCKKTCGLCAPKSCKSFSDNGSPLRTLTTWRTDMLSVQLDNKADAKTAIAAIVPKLCIPCDPRSKTGYECPKGYACTPNVLGESRGCSEYCCTMCEQGEYCPEVHLPSTHNCSTVHTWRECMLHTLTPLYKRACPNIHTPGFRQQVWTS